MHPDTEINKKKARLAGKTFFKASSVVIFLALIAIAAVIFLEKAKKQPLPSGSRIFSEEKTFREDFQKDATLNETAKISESKNPDWWLNSGGLMTSGNGIGKTVQGDLSSDSEWFEKYKKNNSRDTDGGRHPQNIFRLVTRGKWNNLVQESYFRINKINLSESENRNESNGILLMSRYEDGDNLYYTGIRVDGSAIIKKKYEGDYFTLNEKRIFQGEEYDRDENPNLLPIGKWIGLRCELRNTPDGDVDIKLFIDEEGDGNWKLAASALDNGKKEFGTNIISDEGHAGIRTDFMDVEFSGYKIAEVK